MAGYRIISSDSHVYEPRDLWTSRVEPKFRDRAPTLFVWKMAPTGGTAKTTC